jgi:hypothetical protein
MGPDDARAVLRAWLAAIDLDLPGGELLEYLQADDFSHSELFRRARRVHERKLQASVGRVLDAASAGDEGDWTGAATGVFEACVAAIPYAPTTAFQSREKHKLAPRDGEPSRWSPTASAPPTASRAHSRNCASAACRASRSR